MFTKTIHLFFFLILLTSLCSCLSIKKRTYRDGYYIDWISRNSSSPIEGEKIPSSERTVLAKDTVSEPSVRSELFSAGNSEINILPDKNKLVSAGEGESKVSYKKIYYHNSATVLKRADSKLSPVNVLIILVLLTGFVLTFIYRWALWLVLAGLISFMLILLNIVFSKHKVNKNAALNEVPSSEMRVPFEAFLSLVLGLLVCVASFFLHYGSLTILFTIVGSLFSADAIQKIKKSNGAMSGMGIAVAGFVLNFISLLFHTYILILFMEIFI